MKRRRSHKIETVYLTVKNVLEQAKNAVCRSVNVAMVRAYWEIGRIIVEEEQAGKHRATYGKYLLKELADRLQSEFGQGFDESNLRNIRLFYLNFPIRDALRHELTWTHYRLLARVEKPSARDFYLKESINSNWSTRELERQINTLLFERLMLSKNKSRVKALTRKGQGRHKPDDVIKDPYVLEFLGLKENVKYLEKDLEKSLIDNLRGFLLELGKGFTFVSRQKRITVEDDHFYIDLVFYNYLLKCFVLVDLKVGKLTHQDIGQMDFYVRYFEKEIRTKDHNPTIGLILCADKNETMVKYTLLKGSRRIFASRYKLYLPTESELRAEIERGKRFLLNDKTGRTV